ncbi:MAG: sodium:solute symporter, partial [bacterium]|nr:sodium:solute symporter [bacterium]
PTGMTGLLIAAVMAAAMSSVDSSLNCSATLFLQDIYKRYVRRGKEVSERESMRVLYSATLVWGGVGTGAALAMMSVKSALDAWWQLAGIFSGGMLGLFLLGLISRRARNPAAILGVMIGVLVIVWMSLSPQWTGPLEPLRCPFHSFMTIVIGTLTILLVGLLASRIPSRGGQGV